MDDAPPRTAGKRVTLADVARVTGVTKATVSMVVNDKPGVRISAETRARVLEAVAELGYRPDVLAQSLSRGSSRFIGIVSDALATTPFAGEIIRGAQEEAWRRGYTLLIANTGGDGEIEDAAIRMMLEHRVTGILYSTWYHRDVVTPATLRAVPHVLVNCFDPQHPDVCVVPDEEQGGRTATLELLAAGHRNIAFVTSDQDAPATRGRLRGYRSALAEYQGTEAADVIAVSPDQEGGYQAAQRLLSRAGRPSAVFCYNDRVAMGLYDALRERGLSVPDEMSVVGFDNQDVIAAHLRPPLTTVALPHADLGVAGVEEILSDAPTSRVLPCPAVVRSSVAPLTAAVGR